jgi:calcium binding protein 39
MSVVTAEDEKNTEIKAKSIAEALREIGVKDQDSKSPQEIVEKIEQILQLLKNQFAEEKDQERIISDLLAQDVPLFLINNMEKLDAESQKYVSTIFSTVLRKQDEQANPGAEYFAKNPAILETLLESYINVKITFTCGTILRECTTSETLTSILLKSKAFFNLFDYMEHPNFDVASDASYTFKAIITKHKTIAAEFMEQNFENFFGRYIRLLRSDNYVTKRQALKLLGELLLDKQNYSVMMKFVTRLDCFKLVKNLLFDSGRSIQFEAFHVFKIFLANPNKVKISYVILRLLTLIRIRQR